MSTASRYHPRAPRYVFRPMDQRLMRIKSEEKKAIAVAARIRDLSTSGLSFVISGDQAPREGEMLKIEFTLPGDAHPSKRKIAWFASVVRLAPNQDAGATTLVASRFYRLPESLTLKLQKCLGPRVGSEEKADFELGGPSTKELILFTSLAGGTLASFVVMALPVSLWLQPFTRLFAPT